MYKKGGFYLDKCMVGNGKIFPYFKQFFPEEENYSLFLTQ